MLDINYLLNALIGEEQRGVRCACGPGEWEFQCGGPGKRAREMQALGTWLEILPRCTEIPAPSPN